MNETMIEISETAKDVRHLDKIEIDETMSIALKVAEKATGPIQQNTRQAISARNSKIEDVNRKREVLILEAIQILEMQNEDKLEGKKWRSK